MVKIFGLWILAVFYGVYFGKSLIQKRKGIQTDQMAKGKEKGRRLSIERLLKIATYMVVPAEVISIITAEQTPVTALTALGVMLALAGDIFFIVSVVTMRDNWRAGIAEHDKTEMVTKGIYAISRNPAFLGFDCVYIGFLLMFFNWPLLVLSVFAIVMLHLQILQEEKYLEETFGAEYLALNIRNIKPRHIVIWGEGYNAAKSAPSRRAFCVRKKFLESS